MKVVVDLHIVKELDTFAPAKRTVRFEVTGASFTECLDAVRDIPRFQDHINVGNEFVVYKDVKFLDDIFVINQWVPNGFWDWIGAG